MRKNNKLLMPLVVFMIHAQLLYPQISENPVPVNRYLAFARASADWTWDHYDSLEQVWKNSIDPENIFGYRPPPRFLEMACIYAYLYQAEGNEEYAERSEQVLTTYGDYTKYYPEKAMRQRFDYSEGVPALPDFFTAMRYIRAYVLLKEMQYLPGGKQAKIEDIIDHSVNYTLQSQEWGPMNRSALRAETLAWAVRAMPSHPEAASWKMYADALGSDNWGNWEIEDASLYHAVWLYSIIGYAHVTGNRDALFETPEMYYYGQYFLNLMCPDGMIPDYGDAHWRANWSRFLVYFEAAAKAYDNREMKWAAQQLASKFIHWNAVSNTGLAYLLMDAFIFGTDQVVPRKPDQLSMEVMEDMVGKKIVFREGWVPSSTYMLLNYRDEGDGGLLYRDYLRDVIPVEEEKMTHGHADENSIVLLMQDGAVLLHDGGYRDYMPSGSYGAYRQDYFHNRLCVRPEKIWYGQGEGEYRYSIPGHPAVPGQSVLEFLRNAGSYRKVQTKKIDFLTFEDFDYSRTRLIDSDMGYEWDRIVVWVKDQGVFMIFDVMKAVREGFYTAANLWHTRQIASSGDHWYDTWYDSLNHYSTDPGARLLICFPKNHYRFEQVVDETRNYQQEKLIAEFSGQYYELGQHTGFVTVLVPHGSAEDPADWLERIEYIEPDHADDGMSVRLNLGDGEMIQVGVKSDLRMDIVRDYRRPKYTYESGKIKYDAVETNADFFFAHVSGNEIGYTAVNTTRIDFNGKTLFRAKPNYFYLAFDGSRDVEGVGKVRYWRERRNYE
jgi:hypothetical protein